MFTVPKEPLRVVNAEVEREESVLVVDPEEEEQDEEEEGESKGDEPSKREDALLPSLRLEPTAEDKGRAAQRLSTATLEPPVGISPSSSLRVSSIRSATLHTAETVRLERPKTRVLEMVESIESRSRESSPAGSPVRGSPGRE
jgi:hypothetical protein